MSADRELLAELVEKDPALREVLGSKITIADLGKKNKCTMNCNSLTQFSEQITLLYKIVKSGEFCTTLTQYEEQQWVTMRLRKSNVWIWRQVITREI